MRRLDQVLVQLPAAIAQARERLVGWAVLAHNLWVLGRLKLRQDREAAEAATATAA